MNIARLDRKQTLLAHKLRHIFDKKETKEPEIFNIETAQIETEDQLNSYLEKLRTLLLKKIKENKIIIIK